MIEQSEPVKEKPTFTKTSDILPDKRVFCNLKVQSVTVISEKMKFDGQLARIADCLVGDETGCVKYVARDSQLDVIKEGDTLGFFNAHAKVVNGFMRLEVDKWGLIKPSEEEYKISTEINLENNQSDVEYELVPTVYGQPKVNVSKVELEA